MNHILSVCSQFEKAGNVVKGVSLASSWAGLCSGSIGETARKVGGVSKVILGALNVPKASREVGKLKELLFPSNKEEGSPPFPVSTSLISGSKLCDKVFSIVKVANTVGIVNLSAGALSTIGGVGLLANSIENSLSFGEVVQKGVGGNELELFKAALSLFTTVMEVGVFVSGSNLVLFILFLKTVSYVLAQIPEQKNVEELSAAI